MFFSGGKICLSRGKLAWQWNIPIFNRKYIFTQGPFSIATLVYRRGKKTDKKILDEIGLPDTSWIFWIHKNKAKTRVLSLDER